MVAKRHGIPSMLRKLYCIYTLQRLGDYFYPRPEAEGGRSNMCMEENEEGNQGRLRNEAR